jgi:hypothetical protein
VFHVNVAKVDRDVAYVAMAIHVCYKRLFQMFHLFVANVFIWMLHMFHTYVPSVLSGCCTCFYNGFSSVFMCVLQVCSDACFTFFIYLQTYVANVLSVCFKSRSGVAARDPPAAVWAEKVEGARAVSVCG